jgi:hypothetical protein
VAYDCFISYAGADLAYAETLHQRLVSAGFSVWFDKARLREGCDWHREIEAGCEASRVLLPVLTPRWQLSEWTRYETYGAEAVVPVVAEGEWDEIATPPLKRAQVVLIRLADRTEARWQTLFDAIRPVIASPAPQKAERIAHLRYLANPFFVGREKSLDEIHEKLFTSPTAVLTQDHVAAVTALGGVGKTALARQYAEKFWRCYRQMFLGGLPPEPRRRIRRDSRHPPARTRVLALKDSDKALWVRAELSQSERPLRLLILDNAEDEASVAAWTPRIGNCHTIITSRFAHWSPGIETCPVWVLEPGPARELLLRRARRVVTDGPTAALRPGEDSIPPPDQGEERRGYSDPNLASVAGIEACDCDALGEKLEYLPLALEQAAAFVAEQGPGYRFADYLRLYAMHENERKLLARGTPGSTEYPEPVFLTWRATIDKLPAGAKAILRLCSFMSPAPIPVEMLLEGAEILGKEAGVGNSGELEIREWKAALARYSMIRLAADDSFAIHALVQAVERYQLPPDEQPRMVEKAVDLLMSWAPVNAFEFENWPPWKIALPHAERLWQVQQLDHAMRPSRLFLNAYGSFLQSQGAYAAAEPVAYRAKEV